MKVTHTDGRELDATFSLQSAGDSLELVYESRGGRQGGPNPRNLDYMEGLRVLLGRLARIGALIQEIRVDTQRTVNLPIELRRITPLGYALPLVMASVADVNDLRIAISHAARVVGQTEDQRGRPGGSSRRTVLVLDRPDGLTVEQVADRLAWEVPPTPGVVARTAVSGSAGLLGRDPTSGTHPEGQPARPGAPAAPATTPAESLVREGSALQVNPAACPVQWQYYPKSDRIPPHLAAVVDAFTLNAPAVASYSHDHLSNAVLEIVRPELETQGFLVEKSKAGIDRIKVPVLFGRNGSLEKYFDADAVHKDERTVLEVEAGRGVTNNDFLKHLFQACMMHDIDYFAVAVRLVYKGQNNFEQVYRYFDTLYASRRLELPLKGIL